MNNGKMKMGPGRRPPMGRPEAKPDKATIKWMLSYLFAYKWQLLAVVVCIVISSVTGVVSSLFLKTLIDSGYVTENFLQTTYDQQLRAFADGRAAMMVMGSWGVSMIRSMNAGCNFGLFILPASSDGVNWIPSSVGGMLAVSEQSAHKETAIDFLNFFLTNDDVYRQFLQETGNLPVKTGFDAGCDPVLETLISGITDSYPFLDVNWPSGMQMVFLKTVEEISTGGSIDDALDRLDQTWTEIYKKEE